MRFIIFSLILFSPFVAAQEKKAKRSCRILFLNPPAEAPQKLQLFDGSGCQEIDLPEMNFSKVYTIASGDITVKLLRNPIVKPEEVPADAPSAQIAATIADCYLVVSSDPSKPSFPFRFQIIDAGEGKFRKGQMLWYNLTTQPITGQVGTQKLTLKAQSRVILDAPSDTSAAYPVTLDFRAPNDEKVYSLCQTQWIHDPRSRMVVFLYGAGGKVTPQLVGFSDFRDEPKKAE